MRKISLAIPIHDFMRRKHFVIENCDFAERDERISEVILNFEPGEPIGKIGNFKKVKVSINDKREYVYRNKYLSVSKCNEGWVILIDSDNTISSKYLDAIYKIDDWNSNTVYQPDFAMPKFDFRRFANKLFTFANAAGFMNEPLFRTMLNAMNYLLHKETFLRNNKKFFDSGYDPKCADSIFINYNLLKNDGAIQVVPGMSYEHSVHERSWYKQNSRQFGYLVKQFETLIRESK